MFRVVLKNAVRWPAPHQGVLLENLAYPPSHHHPCSWNLSYWFTSYSKSRKVRDRPDSKFHQDLSHSTCLFYLSYNAPFYSAARLGLRSFEFRRWSSGPPLKFVVSSSFGSWSRCFHAGPPPLTNTAIVLPWGLRTFPPISPAQSQFPQDHLDQSSSSVHSIAYLPRHRYHPLDVSRAHGWAARAAL